MKRVKVVGAVERGPGYWVASRSVFEVRLDSSGYDHVMNVALASNLGIRAGWQGTLYAVPDGEAVPRAELALRGEERVVEIIADLGHSLRLGIGGVTLTLTRAQTLAFFRTPLDVGRKIAIRELADAPKPRVRPWRLKTTQWMCPKCNHRAPAGSDRCGHCQTLFDQAHPRDLLGAEE